MVLAKILVVDDDHHILEVVRFALEREGHEVIEASDGEAALDLFETHAPDLLVLDIVMPGIGGLSVCRELRRRSAVPILFLSSRDDESDKVLGLELGGDDYVTKPFSPRELTARVTAALRRAPGAQESVGPQDVAALSCGALLLDPTAHRATLGGEDVSLTVAEFSLLKVFMTRPGRAYSRAQLVELAYGSGHHLTDRTVDSHIRGIRKKLGEEGERIETVYGVGYRFKGDP
jgi:two-component system OmpR family response regulator